MSAKRKPGRPPGATPPLTTAQRKRRSLEKRLQAGGSRLSLVLSPEETVALGSGMKKAGAKEKRAYVARLIVKHR